MKVFVDEDTGSGIGKALKAIDVDAEYVRDSRTSLVHRGTKDEVWLPRVGKMGRLILSRNIEMLGSETETQLIITHKIGIVFLPQDMRRLPLLRLVLRKWEWLEEIDNSEARPFAFSISKYGRPKREVLGVSRPRRQRRASARKQLVTTVEQG